MQLVRQRALLGPRGHDAISGPRRMTGIKTVLRQALELLRLIPRTEFAVVTVDHNPAPDSLPSRQVVLVGDGRSHKWAYLACPCGCGEPIMLSLSKTKR